MDVCVCVCVCVCGREGVRSVWRLRAAVSRAAFGGEHRTPPRVPLRLRHAAAARRHTYANPVAGRSHGRNDDVEELLCCGRFCSVSAGGTEDGVERAQSLLAELPPPVLPL